MTKEQIEKVLEEDFTKNNFIEFCKMGGDDKVIIWGRKYGPPISQTCPVASFLRALFELDPLIFGKDLSVSAAHLHFWVGGRTYRIPAWAYEAIEIFDAMPNRHKVTYSQFLYEYEG